MYQIRKDLCEQVVGDFKEWMAGTGAHSSDQIKDLCRVVSVLDPNVKSELTAWYVKQQLTEYVVLFEDTQDSAWLDKIDHRYRNRDETDPNFRKTGFGDLFEGPCLSINDSLGYPCPFMGRGGGYKMGQRHMCIQPGMFYRFQIFSAKQK